MSKLELKLLLFILLNLLLLGIGYLITKDDLWFKTTTIGIYFAVIWEIIIFIVIYIISKSYKGGINN